MILFSFFLVNCSACGTTGVLDISVNEAAELLQKGDTRFILNAELPADFSGAQSRLTELSRIHPAAPFYAGLLAASAGNSVPGDEGKNTRSPRELSILLFCAALESPSPSARREAALKLIPLILGTENLPGDIDKARAILDLLDSERISEKMETLRPLLRAACLYRLGRYDEVSRLLSKDSADKWEKALALFAAWKSIPAASRGPGDREFPLSPSGNTSQLKDETLSFLFEPLPGEIRRWMYGEMPLGEGLLAPEEALALSAVLAPENYTVTLEKLRPALKDGGVFFFRFPRLIAELGRAYQYTPALRDEGAELFAMWDTITEEAGNGKYGTGFTDIDESGEHRTIAAFIETMSGEELKNRRYSILFYAGRIARTREEYAASSEYFTRALGFAATGLEADACIWYVLMNEYAFDPAAAIQPVLNTMPQWTDSDYFDDILDFLSGFLCARREWDTLFEIFRGLEKRGASASLAKYAWILGRVKEEGYFSADRRAEDFFRIALETEGSFYYRAMAAAKLGEKFVPGQSGEISAAAPGREPDRENGEPGDKNPSAVTEAKGEAEFLLAFFEYGASSFVMPYVQAREKELSAPELRKIAEAFAEAAMWKESLDLVSRYTGRKNYKTSREDLSLFYPRPYRELIEKYSSGAGLGPEILYGLIRTESYFQSSVISHSGAVGLAQLMVPTALDMAGRIARLGGPDYRESGEIDLKNPEVNVHLGSFYLNYLTEQMESPMPALLAYNGGMGRMRRWLAADRARGGLPEDIFLETIEFIETREYGRRVLAAAAAYGYLYYGMSMEEVAADLYPAVYPAGKWR